MQLGSPYDRLHEAVGANELRRLDRNTAMTLAYQKLSCCEPGDRQPDAQRAKACEVNRLDQSMTHTCLPSVALMVALNHTSCIDRFT